jgi:RHS repeat-associated protein
MIPDSRMTNRWSAAFGNTIYAYDLNGNSTNIWSSTSGGVNLQYAYDPLNRITNVLAGGTAAASYGFNGNGNLQSIRYGNGVTNLYQYDQLNRLTNCVWNSNALTLASFYYQLGASGTRTNLTETILTLVTNRTYAWSYDTLYRLTNESIGTLGNLGYKYDPVGNRTNRLSTGSVATPLPSAINSFSQNDWLTNDAYDSNGNTLWDTNATPVGPYSYDVENRLINFNNAVYLGYNGDGIRVTKTANGTNSYYLVDDRNPSGYAQVLEEWTAGGGVTNLSKVYAFGLSLISQRQLGATTNYFIPDGHGSTRLLVDSSGNVANGFTYDAYGTLIASNVAPQTAYLYCGEQFDPNLGFYYLRARYYQPQTGRFWTMDTFEGELGNPTTLHKYVSCRDNPADGTDPSGRADESSLDSLPSVSSRVQSSLIGALPISAAAAASLPTKMLSLHAVVMYFSDFSAADVQEYLKTANDIFVQAGIKINLAGNIDAWDQDKTLIEPVVTIQQTILAKTYMGLLCRGRTGRILLVGKAVVP